MTADLAWHTVTEAVFDDLAGGGGGREVARALVSARRSRTLAFLRLLATDRDPAAAQAFAVLGDLRAHDPDAVTRVLDDPVVGLWATAALLRGDRGQSTPGCLAQIAAAVAIRAGVVVELLFTAPTTVLPSLGTVEPIVGRARTDRLRWTPFPAVRLAPGVRWTFGGWPQGLLPDGLGLAVRPDFALWQERLEAAWELLATDHPVVAAELAELVSAVTPLEPSDVGEASATVGDALGCVFLSLSADAEMMAVTLAHEVHHAKLTVLMDLFPLFDTADDRLFYAPWRTDPRPVAGLLHGAYAHLAIAGFWRERRQLAESARAHQEFARWREATWTVSQILLDSGALTPLGHRFVCGIRDRVQVWLSEAVPASDLRTATRLLAEHRQRWASGG
ncbi:aKG-HExxH-type peptide beta-hydroxylase [Actinokineospora globicatena]|uniref:HEXXH motif domain-containing protein n=1 Tax=Actinokineospora globicatena TaxID=103729 RepID=A0A9W6QMK2_9PSEU|nr:HEXXH motif-containing putative peptide modification protein [Actinokineospora globicatena]GLW91254.1 HEXXH motif domain-containing protein [Actinokineospora globicatena]